MNKLLRINKAILCFTFVIVLFVAMLPSIPAYSLTGYQWIEGIPIDILYEEDGYSMSQDEIDAAEGYFTRGLEDTYAIIGYNCRDDEVMGYGTPVCQRYYSHVGNTSNPPVFAEFCRFYSPSGCASSDFELRVISPDRACALDALFVDNKCTTAVTINKHPYLGSSDAEEFVEDSLGIDFSAIETEIIEETEDNIEDAPITDEGGEPLVDEDGGEEGEEDNEPTCESEGGVFGWILCAVLDLILDGLEIFANAVENRLRIGIDDESSFRAAWNGLRIIGNIIFIMAFLAIIISQTIVGRF